MITKERLKYLLLDMLIADGNETIFMSKEAQNKYSRLIVLVTKAYYDIRFCGNKVCVCHPEHDIKLLLQDKELSDFLKKNRFYYVLQEHIEDYNPKVNIRIHEE